MPHGCRQKWIVRREFDGAVLGIWFDAQQGQLCVGGPGRWRCCASRLAVVLPQIGTALKSIDCNDGRVSRWRIILKCTEEQLTDIFTVLRADGWEAHSVKAFRRLMY